MDGSGDVWKEWGLAKDEFGQHLYMERWERLQGGGGGRRVALRRRMEGGARDAYLVACDDHFNYIVARPTPQPRDAAHAETPGLVPLVDGLTARGELEAYLSQEAGHGRVSRGWTVDAALHPWHEGSVVFHLLRGEPRVQRGGRTVAVGDDTWDVLECTESEAGLQQLLSWRGGGARL